MQKNNLLFILCSLISGAIWSQGLVSRSEAKLDQVQSEYGLSGNGVLTIMMDRGIDYRHPDFIDPNGKTRIAYIFDLYDNSGANDVDNPFGIGTIYDSTEINAALQSGGIPITNDLFGHGTATTGIMAGNGSGIQDEERFRGVAFQSKIISIIVTKDFVPPFGNNQGQDGAFDPNLLPTAFEFAKQKIAELNLPSVTLLNIGSIQDPTDGSIELCSTIEDYVSDGHPFVCGVGDDGGKDNHLIGTFVQNQTTEITIQKGEVGNLRFTGWYSENDRVELSIERPDGTIEGPFNPPSGPGNAQDNFLDQINIFHRGADVEFSKSNSNLRQLLIDFSGAIGTYKVLLTPTEVNSDGKINAFLNPALYNNSNSFLNNESPGGNINSFSACPSTISPGDYVATNSWMDINGNSRMKTGEGDPGELWIGSSTGPTMDGRLGIDLVAPGEVAAAAYGEDSFYASFDFNILEGSDRFYGVQTAVSAAAPIVTGVIALMLEVNPNLTPIEIKTILQESARTDDFTGSTPNAQWGHGKLDAYAAVTRAINTVNTNTTLNKNSTVTIRPNPFNHYIDIELNYPIQSSQSLSFSLYSINGQKMKEGSVGNNDRIQLGEDLARGIYFLWIKSDEEVFVNKIIKQ